MQACPSGRLCHSHTSVRNRGLLLDSIAVSARLRLNFSYPYDRFVAFGIGLDPRQQMLYGPALGPVAVGLTVGLIVFATAGLAPGYPGASMNPNRCFAFAVARGDFQGKSYRLFLEEPS